MKVFAACDDFDSEKQPPACAFPCDLCAPCVLCGEGVLIAPPSRCVSRFRVCSQADQKVWPTLQPQKTSASSATSAFQGFDPGFGCGSVALCFKVLFLTLFAFIRVHPRPIFPFCYPYPSMPPAL